MATNTKPTNETILESMRTDLAVQGVNLPEDLSDGKAVRDIVLQFPATANAFISTLTNKIVKSLIYSKNFENPLKKLKKGYIENGEGIEQLFVKDARIKNFGDNYDESGNTPEGDLIRKITPEVVAMYIKDNYDKKGKTTVMDKELRKAFTTEYGLAGLVSSIVASVQNGLEKKEFKTCKNLLGALVNGKEVDTINDTIGENAITAEAWKQPLVTINYTGGIEGNAKKMLKDIRRMARTFTFPSDKYNPAKVETWSNRQDLVFVTTPEVEAEIDVEALAYIFNLDKAEIQYSVIVIDEIPNVSDNGEILGVLMDKEFIQIWDTWRNAGSFYNPEGQYTNYFANNENIFAGCLYAQAVVFKKPQA